VPHNYIITVADIKQGRVPQLQPIAKINNTDNNSNTANNANNSSHDNDNNSSNNNDDSIRDDNESIKTSVINSDQDNQNDDKNNNKNKNNNTTGVCRFKCKNKGKTDSFSNYGLFMAARHRARAGPHRATIQDGAMFFSAADPSNAKPLSVKDCKEWVLGVALAQYSMGASIINSKRKGKQD
jgi:hypothetical protein